MKKKGGLGRGLDAFFADTLPEEKPAETPMEIAVTEIDPNPHQPRRSFDEAKLRELADSIAVHGVLQPLVLVKRGDRYILVAGERRWRAARMAGLRRIPARVLELEEKEIAEISLVENLQRDDLNAIEEARGIDRLMREFSLTQEEAAGRLGKSRSAVANALRLLRLPEEVQDSVSMGTLSAGHARVLAGFDDPDLQKELAEAARRDGLSVRQMEELGRRVKTDPPSRIKNPIDRSDPAFRELQEAMSRLLGTKVLVSGTLEKGKITVEYYQREDLERIYELVLKMQ